jgi:hypothetical protein
MPPNFIERQFDNAANSPCSPPSLVLKIPALRTKVRKFPMPESLTGLLIVLIALLPGGVHTWAFERATGKSDQQASDRIPRFLAASAVYLVVFAVPATPILRAIAESARTGTTTAAWRYAAAFALLIVLPFTIGSLMGWLTSRRHEKGLLGWLGRRIGGVGHATRAWDHLFAVKELTGTIRVVLADNTHLIGTWGRREKMGGLSGDPPTVSYASGCPNPQRDLYIAHLIRIDYPGGKPSQDSDGAAWVPGESIRYIEFYPHERRSNS